MSTEITSAGPVSRTTQSYLRLAVAQSEGRLHPGIPPVAAYVPSFNLLQNVGDTKPTIRFCAFALLISPTLIYDLVVSTVPRHCFVH